MRGFADCVCVCVCGRLTVPPLSELHALIHGCDDRRNENGVAEHVAVLQRSQRLEEDAAVAVAIEFSLTLEYAFGSVG